MLPGFARRSFLEEQTSTIQLWRKMRFQIWEELQDVEDRIVWQGTWSFLHTVYWTCAWLLSDRYIWCLPSHHCSVSFPCSILCSDGISVSLINESSLSIDKISLFPTSYHCCYGTKSYQQAVNLSMFLHSSVVFQRSALRWAPQSAARFWAKKDCPSWWKMTFSRDTPYSAQFLRIVEPVPYSILLFPPTSSHSSPTFLSLLEQWSCSVIHLLTAIYFPLKQFKLLATCGDT